MTAIPTGRTPAIPTEATLDPRVLDCYTRNALAALGESIEAAGHTIKTVAHWPHTAPRDQHALGALTVARRASAGIEALLAPQPQRILAVPDFFDYAGAGAFVKLSDREASETEQRLREHYAGEDERVREAQDRGIISGFTTPAEREPAPDFNHSGAPR